MADVPAAIAILVGDDVAEDGHDDVLDHRGDDRAESAANDDRDGQVDHVPLEREVSKFLPQSFHANLLCPWRNDEVGRLYRAITRYSQWGDALAVAVLTENPHRDRLCASAPRRSARAVEWTGLENRQARKGLASSNLASSVDLSHITYPGEHMVKRTRALLAIALATFIVPLIAKAADEQADQQPKVFEKQVTVRLNYLLFLPEGYAENSDKKWPLMLFLHGAGERGSDVNKVKAHGPPKIVEKRKDFPFIVVSPQCPADSWWRPYELVALLDEIQKDYRVDADRVYLTGLSMGGFGTWELASQYPQRFAAIAPICGGGNAAQVRRLKDLPIWVFHGDADSVVPVARSDEMVEALKKVGADVKYTRYEGIDHDSWTKSYANEELYEWMLSHKRGEARSAAAAPAAPAPAA